MKFLNKIAILVLSLCLLENAEATRFNADYAPRLYTFQGQFGFHTPFKDVYYKINTISDFEIAPNKLVRLQPLIADRWGSVSINNGTKIILTPELTATGYTANQKKQVSGANPFVIIEGQNDFISIYIYTQGYGNKLVFNIQSFEQFMRNTWWYNHLGEGSAYDWNIGFEFYTAEADFEGISSPSFLMAQGINMFDIELHWKNNTFSSVQYLYSLIGNNNKADKSKWNPNLLFDNNILYKKALSDDDVSHVEKILTDAGIKFN